MLSSITSTCVFLFFSRFFLVSWGVCCVWAVCMMRTVSALENGSDFLQDCILFFRSWSRVTKNTLSRYSYTNSTTVRVLADESCFYLAIKSTVVSMLKGHDRTVLCSKIAKAQHI